MLSTQPTIKGFNSFADISTLVKFIRKRNLKNEYFRFVICKCTCKQNVLKLYKMEFYLNSFMIHCDYT